MGCASRKGVVQVPGLLLGMADAAQGIEAC